MFFAIVPLAPLALVLLQAGSRHTATGAGTASGDASGPWGPITRSGPQGPGLLSGVTQGRRAGNDGGLTHESLSEVFHRVVSLWATFRGTTC